MCDLSFIKDVFVSYMEDAVYREELQDIIDHFGMQRQVIKLHEESGELAGAWLRYNLGIYPTNLRVTEEFTDLLFVMLQIMKESNIDPNEVIKLLEQLPSKTKNKYNMSDPVGYNLCD